MRGTEKGIEHSEDVTVDVVKLIDRASKAHKDAAKYINERI